MFGNRRYIHTALFVSLACYALVMVASCGLFNNQKNDEQALVGAIDRFNTDLKWEDYKSAATRMAPSVREDFWGQVERLQGRIRILDYQIVETNLQAEAGQGTAVLRVRYYAKRNPQLQTATIRQRWIFMGREQGWQAVENGLEKLMT